MEINHFSHPEHPLILVADVEPDEGKDSRHDLVCNGCHEPVIITTPLPSGYYRCGSGCEFTLHKRCAELPPQIHYPDHPRHPLVLLSSPRFQFDGCDMCRRRGWKWFSYSCYECFYNVDVVCALAYLEAQKMLVCDNSEIHQRPLNLHLKPAKFFCDFCFTEDVEDFPYICPDRYCSFWIHKRCALAPPTLNLIHTHPDHPLCLSSSIPKKYRTFRFYCDICKKLVDKHHWLYYCAKCRFFSHIQCAFDALDHPPSGGQHDDLEEEDKEVIDPNDPFMKLPFQDSETMTDALSLYFKDSATAKSTLLPHKDDDNTEFMKHHWSHNVDHPLTLVVKAPSDNNVANIVSDDPITVCDGCVRPISIPYYFCGQCHFYLHQHCAKLPLTLFNHVLHPNHPLELKCNPDPLEIVMCEGCNLDCNKFLYQCDACEFYLDVNCAFLPQRIKHEKHKHPLLQCLVFVHKSDVSGKKFKGIAFRCDKANCSFLISLFDAMLPHCIQHRYDKEHPILLTYPPVKDHPQQFFCEICEEEIHPKYWMYHCGPCAFSFHTHCLYRQDWYSNVKLEPLTYTSSELHRHGPLSYTRRKKNSKKFLCSLCNLDINGHLILECNQCKFQICYPACGV